METEEEKGIEKASRTGANRRGRGHRGTYGVFKGVRGAKTGHCLSVSVPDSKRARNVLGEMSQDLVR